MYIKTILNQPSPTNSMGWFLLFVFFILGMIPASPNALTFDPTFERLNAEDGLSQSIVWTVLQDRRGFMWFGTQEGGLNKYDGYEFTIYSFTPDDSTGIAISNISHLYEDQAGIIWLGTWGEGLVSFDPDSEIFIHFRHYADNLNSISSNRAQYILEGQDGTLWVGTAGGGLNKMDRQTMTFRHFSHNPDNPASISHNRVWQIAEAPSGDLWIATSNGLNHFDPKTETFSHFFNDPDDSHSLSHSRIRSLYFDRGGVLWVGTQNGLNKFDADSKTFIRYQHDPQVETSLTNNIINAIYEDLSGNLWVGTSTGGLNMMNRGTSEFTHFMHDPNNPQSISHNDVRRLYLDRSNILWITTRGGGVNKLDLKPPKFNLYRHRPFHDNSLNNNRIRTIYEDQAGTFWIGTDGGGLNSMNRSPDTGVGTFAHFERVPDDPLSLNEDDVLSICEDQYGILWVGTDSGGLNRFDPKTSHFRHYMHDRDDPTSISDNDILSLLEDKDGVLWIGTEGGGLNNLVRDKSGDPYSSEVQFKRVSTDPNDPTKFDNDDVSAIFEDAAGNIWFATDNGVITRDKKNDTLTKFLHDSTDPNSISSDEIFAIGEDTVGLLWMGTSYGLNAFDRAQNKFKTYTEVDGLPSSVIYGVLTDDQQNVWVSTLKGLSRFDSKTQTFYNFDASDGLQSSEFIAGSCYKTRTGELFFGGINGLNSFYPDQVKDNPHVPPVVLTTFKKFDKVVNFDQAMPYIEKIEISYKERFFGFEFAALDYTNPGKNHYAYMLEGFDHDWIQAGNRRYASYTNLDGGEYILKVKGSNNDHLWNETPVAIIIKVIPPLWKTWWFYLLEALFALGLIILGFNFQRTRLHRQKEEALRALDLKRKTEELDRARLIQETLIPKVSPQVEGFDIMGRMKTAKQVGGDYFDLIPSISGDKFYTVIADVSGKGMPACLLMVEVRSVIHTLTYEDLSTREILIRTNELIFKDVHDMGTPMMVTLLLMCWDKMQQKLYYTGAGHDPFVVYRAATGTCDVIESGGMWLGIESEIADFLDVKTVELSPGDVLFLYTDGVTEYHNPAQEMFELDGLIKHLNASGSKKVTTIVNDLFERLDEFGAGADQHDDITVVAMKRT